MRLIVGLGNPGKKYQNNRHNVGQMFIDYLATKFKNNKVKELKFFKTSVFMNESGKEVKKITMNHELSATNLYVAHDDLDIPIGKFKIVLGRGPQLHNGLESIETALGTNEFWRIRIGVENRTPENRPSGEEYVLSDFTKEEKEIISKTFSIIADRLAQHLSLPV